MNKNEWTEELITDLGQSRIQQSSLMDRPPGSAGRAFTFFSVSRQADEFEPLSLSLFLTSVLVSIDSWGGIPSERVSDRLQSGCWDFFPQKRLKTAAAAGDDANEGVETQPERF